MAKEVSKKTLDKYYRQLRLIEEHREATANNNIQYYYKQLLKNLQEFLGVEYAQYAKDDQLTYAILQQKGHYARFLEEVEARIDDISPKVSEEIQKAVHDTYEIAYNGMVEGVQKAKTSAELYDTFKGLKTCTPYVIKRAVENPITGLTLKDTLEQNRKEIIYGIKKEIGIGLMNGDRMSTMANRIKNHVDKDYRKSMLIARTEVHRVREAGHADACDEIDKTLTDNNTDYRMVKTWRNMKDERVRPQVRRKTKKGWKTYISKNGANHVVLGGQVVLSTEKFDLGNGVTARSPGQSGVAAHDCNCRCFVEYDLMNDDEYYQATGKHFPGYENPVKKLEQKEQNLIHKQEALDDEYFTVKSEMLDMESKTYENIWKDPVTVKDYEAKQGAIQAKLDYFDDQYVKTGDKKFHDLYNKTMDFDDAGKEYLAKQAKLKDIDDNINAIKADLKKVKTDLMKELKIDPDEMLAEIKDIKKKIAALDKPAPIDIDKLVKTKDVSKLYDYDLGYDFKGKDYFTDKSAKADIDEAFANFKKMSKSAMDKDDEEAYELLQKFFDDLDDIAGVVKKPKSNQEIADLLSSGEHKYSGVKFKYYEIDEYFEDDSTKDFLDNAWDTLKKKKKTGSLSDFDKEKYDDMKKFMDAVDDINKENKKLGKAYLKEKEKLEKLLDEAQEKYDKVVERFGLDKIDDDAFSKERKDAAYWFTDKNGGAKGADKVLRDKCGEVWRNATDAQKKSAYEYTRSYSKYNEPLRGIEYGTNKFIGVGKIDLDMIGVGGYGNFKRGEVKKLIDDLSDIIDKSSYDHDMWFNRGCRRSGMDKFFGIDPSDFNLSESELAAKLLGTTPTEYGFMSTGVAKGSGFGGEIKLNIYAPKGTKYLYCEPFSAFGNGDGRSWDGIAKQSSIGYEAEALFQHGTQFRVIKVEKSGSTWYFDLEVIGQGGNP